MQETWVRSLGREEPLEKDMATHSSILAWRIPWTEEPGRLQSMGSQRVGHNWATNTWSPQPLIFFSGKKFEPRKTLKPQGFEATKARLELTPLASNLSPFSQRRHQRQRGSDRAMPRVVSTRVGAQTRRERGLMWGDRRLHMALTGKTRRHGKVKHKAILFWQKHCLFISRY